MVAIDVPVPVASAVVVVAALAIALVVLTLTQRRGTSRRLAAVASRLDGRSLGAGGRGTERTLQRIEHAAEQAVEAVHTAEATTERLRQAFGSVHQGVVVCDEHGATVFRNGLAAAFADARHADVIAEQEIVTLLGDARSG